MGEEFLEGITALSTFHQDLQRMLEDTTFSDMAFLCGAEEEEVRACKMLVASRSPVLKSMLLTSGMAECTLAHVPLPDIQPPTMRICLEFLYTDSVKDTSWCNNILLGLNVIKAASFFLLERLVRLAVVYLTRSNYLNDEDFITAYNLGVSLHRPLKEMKELLLSFGQCIHKFMEANSDRCLVYRNLSELALAHLVCIPHQYGKGISSEYFSFVHMVRWSAYRVSMVHGTSLDDEQLVIKALHRCLPWKVKELLKGNNIELDDAKISSFMKLIADLLAECLQRVPLHFANIPTHILSKVIEPLNLIPPSTLLTAYKLQAFSRSSLRWDQFTHGKNYVIEEDNRTIISCNEEKKFQGFAMCGTDLSVITASSFDWEIVMLTRCPNLRIGFYLCQPSSTALDCNNHLVGDMQGSWAVTGDGFLHYTSLDGEKHTVPHADSFCGIEKAIVHVDLVNRSCSFAVNGKAAKMAWENLPIGDDDAVYPAISLQKPGKAQIQVVYQDWMSCPTKRTS